MCQLRLKSMSLVAFMSIISFCLVLIISYFLHFWIYSLCICYIVFQNSRGRVLFFFFSPAISEAVWKAIGSAVCYDPQSTVLK